MKVALTVNDFLRRAELVYPKRIGIVDEPDQPAESWGTLTYSQVGQRARAIVRACTHWDEPKQVLEACRGLGKAMDGIEMSTLSESERLANRGW